jgi:hypothetical protein
MPNVEIADAGGDAPNMLAIESHGAELCTPASKKADRKIVVARGSSTTEAGIQIPADVEAVGSGGRYTESARLRAESTTSRGRDIAVPRRDTIEQFDENVYSRRASLVGFSICQPEFEPLRMHSNSRNSAIPLSTASDMKSTAKYSTVPTVLEAATVLTETQ